MPKPQSLPSEISNFIVTLHINKNSEVLAFAEVHFIDTSGNTLFKVKGFKIKIFKGNRKSSLSVDFPAYQSGNTYRKSFIAEGEMFGFIKDKILEQYQLATSQTTFANDDIDDIITK
ncbi:MAG: hypothetical protein COV78_00175 [Candidatus Pacebacteria bacterium CG11_big_fil_rev_8_21_14_0_20_34_55]|nr:MAG: hypothetical protein COV78_00175 [Candidatus Pacebacteria bacterium CG11_big_fil_rev_8_21_14_0_20_34_55]